MVVVFIVVLRLYCFLGYYYFKGFFVIFIVVEVVGNVVLWYYWYNFIGERILYLDVVMVEGKIEISLEDLCF